MDTFTIKSRAKSYCIRAGSWVAMVLVTVIVVVFIGHFLLPRTLQLTTPSKLDGDVSSGAKNQYGIKEIIRAVRADLVAAQDTLVANKEEELFQVETFDIELSFVVTRGVKTNANVEAPKFLVVGADTEYKKEQIQKIQLHFRVHKPPSDRYDILDEIPAEDEVIDLN